MLNKIRAIWDYIKKNNVWGELKDRFVNVLEWYKSKIANGWRSWIGATGPQATSSSPLHKTAMSAIKKYTNKNPIKTDIGKNDKRIMNQRNDESAYIDETGENPWSPDADPTTMLRYNDRLKMRNMSPEQYEAAREKASKREIKIAGQRNEEDNRPDYSRQALTNF